MDAIAKAVEDAKAGAVETRTAAEWYDLLEKHVEQHQKPNETFEAAFSRLTLKGHAALLMKAQTMARRFAKRGDLPALRGNTDRSYNRMDLRKSRIQLIAKKNAASDKIESYIAGLQKADEGMTYEAAFAKAWSTGSPVLTEISAMREIDGQIRRIEYEARKDGAAQ